MDTVKETMPINNFDHPTLARRRSRRRKKERHKNSNDERYTNFNDDNYSSYFILAKTR